MIDGRNWLMTQKAMTAQFEYSIQFYQYILFGYTYSPSGRLLELISINYNICGLICNINIY
jgi:hypothetical protein